MGRGRRGHAAYSDQYGEVGVSQDRDMPPMGKQTMGSGSGGGTAGRTTVKGSVSYTRQLPKFLQKHAHLLAKAPAEAEAVGAEPDDVPDNDDTHDAAAIARAMAEDPSLLEQYPELQATADKARAIEEKERGNTAFNAGKHDEAIKHYSSAIQLDPTNEVYFSNRAAAYQSAKRYTEALQDARAAVRLKPEWVKGYQRLAAAAWALDDVSEAVLAYEKALELQPSSQELQLLLSKARHAEEQLAQTSTHKFKAQRVAEVGERPGKKRKLPGEGLRSTGAAVKDKNKLSFGEEEEDDS